MVQTKLGKKDISEMLKILEIPHTDWSDSISLGQSEKKLLNQEKIKDLSENFMFIGSDGTTARISEDDAEAPTIISGSSVMWGITQNRTKTVSYDQKMIIEGKDRLTHSSIRTVLEFKIGICLLIARKFKMFVCDGCPFSNSGCQWQNSNLKPWEEFPEKTAVAIFDLPVNFIFITSLKALDQTNRSYLMSNVQRCFADIKKYDLPAIFVTHKSRLNIITHELTSELDDAINSLNQKTKDIIKWIAKQSSAKKATFASIGKFNDLLQQKEFSDFDLFDDYFTSIAKPSPTFTVNPEEYNNKWEEMKFHYFTWGYSEYSQNKWVFLPSGWIRIGYSPALTPQKAHEILCLEMILGKGHSISLSMAHTACNLHKRELLKILPGYYNKNRADKYKLGYNTKTMSKWSMFK